MSPTILIEDGYKVMIYTNDHEPAHVHVEKAENDARLLLEPVEVTNSYGFKSRELRKIEAIVTKHLPRLLAAWYEIHGE